MGSGYDGVATNFHVQLLFAGVRAVVKPYLVFTRL